MRATSVLTPLTAEVASKAARAASDCAASAWLRAVLYFSSACLNCAAEMDPLSKSFFERSKMSRAAARCAAAAVAAAAASAGKGAVSAAALELGAALVLGEWAGGLHQQWVWDAQGRLAQWLPYSDLAHIEDCVREIETGTSDKATKTVSRTPRTRGFFRAIRRGFFLGDPTGLKFYPFPSRDNLEIHHAKWWHSASAQ